MEYFFPYIMPGSIDDNDCANSFTTSVGTKVITLRQAVLVAAIF